MNKRQGRSDDGAVLILALIIVTVVAVVTSVVLSFADASIRVTVSAARPEASTAATADGAAQIAINTLRKSSYSYLSTGLTGGLTGANCFLDSGGNPGPGLALDNYPAAGASAYVQCAPDPASAVQVPITNLNRPTTAVLTLGGLASEGFKATINGLGSNGTVGVSGNVFSHSTISVLKPNTSLVVMPPVPGQPLESGQLAAWVRAAAGCTQSQIVSSDKNCNDAASDPLGADPGYVAASAVGATAGTPPAKSAACPGNSVSLVTFSPGIYTSAAALNALTDNGGCHNGTIFRFLPGNYFFDFGTAGGTADVWSLNDAGYLVAGDQSGTTPALVPGTVPTIPGACDNPLKKRLRPDNTPQRGVAFVFGGDSQLVIKAGQAEICGTYSAGTPAVAIYGLKAASGAVHAETGCITQTPYTGSGAPCAVLATQSTNSILFVQGTTYVPNAAVDVTLNNATSQVFESGIMARALFLTMTSSFTSPPGGVIRVPNDSPGYASADDVLYLNVFLCAKATGCNASGTLRLRAKVDLVYYTDSHGVTTRRASVTNWSVLR